MTDWLAMHPRWTCLLVCLSILIAFYLEVPGL